MEVRQYIAKRRSNRLSLSAAPRRIGNFPELISEINSLEIWQIQWKCERGNTRGEWISLLQRHSDHWLSGERRTEFGNRSEKSPLPVWVDKGDHFISMASWGSKWCPPGGVGGTGGQRGVISSVVSGRRVVTDGEWCLARDNLVS